MLPAVVSKSIRDYFLPIFDHFCFVFYLCKKTFLSIANDPAHRLHNMLQSSGPSCYNLRCKRRFAIPKCKTERFKNSFLVRSCIDSEFQRSVSFVNEIDDVVYILTVLSFFIFLGCYYLFRTLSLSFYYTHYCKILLYYILYCKYTIQLSSCKLFTNKLSIYLSIYLSTILVRDDALDYIHPAADCGRSLISSFLTNGQNV